MHCNLRQPDAAQSLSALISSPVPSLNSLKLSVAVLESFYCWYVMLRCNLDLWPWTFVVYQLCHDQTLLMYQIWAKSSNLRRSYMTLWPKTCITCCAMLCFCYVSKFLHPLRHAVTLIFDPLTLNSYDRSSVLLSNYLQNLSKIDQSAAELLTI